MESQIIMRPKFLVARAPLVMAALLSGGALTACAHPSNTYDSRYEDQHRWNRREDAAYRRWEMERHYRHIDYQRRVAEEQRAYWYWRHQHPG
jgi:hypothetical protein